MVPLLFESEQSDIVAGKKFHELSQRVAGSPVSCAFSKSGYGVNIVIFSPHS